MNKLLKYTAKRGKTTSILLGIFFLTIYFLTSPGNTPYDYFARLADAFLKGKYWIEENPPWLSELIPKDGRFYIVHPPMPTLLLLPFRVIFGGIFQQQFLAHIVGSLIAVLVYRISLKIKNDQKLALWSSIMIGTGSIIWYMSSVGSSWYLGQTTACLFLLLAIEKLLENKNTLLMGVFIGAAYLSRVHTIISLPFFLFNLKEKELKNILKIFLGIMPFFVFNSIYNYVRFGTILDKGYALIPNIFEEPWYQKGLVHPAYIPSHIKIILFGMPKIIEQFPYIIPSWNGLAIWITTPGFILSLFAPIKKKLVKLAWLAVSLISLVIFSHGSTGFTQFGYRFAVDFYPFLIPLTILGAARIRNTKIYTFLVFLGFIVNLWGVLWINKFQWVSF